MTLCESHDFSSSDEYIAHVEAYFDQKKARRLAFKVKPNSDYCFESITNKSRERPWIAYPDGRIKVTKPIKWVSREYHFVNSLKNWLYYTMPYSDFDYNEKKGVVCFRYKKQAMLFKLRFG